uniref:Poly [ADP-ribose] polymerase n=1 Tax=Alexandrium monilatum TaxID=311494 RepID=A0A7S4R657_9DINO|mmetsp:Transcript_55851/g.166114  ORF Transcript_55851/g.166114 Transcript_55851/m.166114 type:complete len:399 (-) Transcript_55851:143-1339(-)
MMQPGTRLCEGHPSYGKGAGHFELESERYRGRTTMAVGAVVCCCTGCPCGFCLKLDERRTRVWVTESPWGQPAAAPAPMAMGAPAAAPAPAPSAGIVRVRCGGTCGQIVSVQPQGTGIIQFVCPHCRATNQITYRGGAGGGRGEPVPLPPWWRRQPAPGESVLCSVSGREQSLMQQLLDLTWKAAETRDRQKFGGGPAARFQVVHVQQNCNPTLWANYVRARDDIAAKVGNAEPISCKTSETLLALPEGAELLGPLETGVNEFLLFHGTKPSACESICKSDFMVRLAGSNAGALYGPGIYFAECSSKSDEYASDDPTGIYSGLYAMLLCRVTCGRTLYTDEVHPNVDDLVRRCTVTGEYDSVLGDREKARGTYREFIVFNNDQAYPAYVIIYKRLTED